MFDAWKEQEIGRESIRLYGLSGDADADALVDFQRRQIEVRASLSNQDFHDAVLGFDERLGTALLTAGIGVPVDHAIWPILRPLFRAAWLDAITIIDALTGALDSSGQSKIVRDSTQATVAGPNCPPTTIQMPRKADRRQSRVDSPRLSELVELYILECDAEEDYAIDVRMYARRLQESLGENRVARTISKRDMITFLSEISRLPARLAQSERKMPLPQLLGSLGEESPQNRMRRRLSAKTTEKWFQCLGAMFRFGLRNDFCDINPTEGLRRFRKKNLEPPRQHFEQDEIRMIFSSPLYHGNDADAYRCGPGRTITRDAKYWLPQLALFTGCRRDEMVQARVSDVKHQDGIHFLHINTSSDDGGRKKKVKTASSRRMVPLHMALIDAGFLKYTAGLRERSE